MMYRAQVGFEPELHRRARKRAEELGISLAEYVRRLVARDLARPHGDAEPASIFDLGSSAESNVAEHKDSYLGEAFDSHTSR